MRSSALVGSPPVGPIRLSEHGDLIIPALSAESVPAGTVAVRAELMELSPRPRLASLLIELDSRVGFTDALVHAGGKDRGEPSSRRLRRPLQPHPQLL